MKRLFTIAAMVFAVAMTACTDPNENPYDGAPDPVFTLSTSSVEVPQTGGNIEVPFTIENPGEWAQLRATTSTSWIKNLAWDQENGKITFSTAPNNTDDPLTDGVITVAYDFKEYNISVTQLGIAYDYKWTVPADGFVQTNLGWTSNDKDAYAIMALVTGLNEETLEGMAAITMVLPYAGEWCMDMPTGTYTVDTLNTMAAKTVIGSFSYISTDVENEFDATASFASGTVEMAEDGFIARMFDVDGKSYRIECDTVPHFDMPLEKMYNLKEIAGDYEMAFEDMEFEVGAQYWGDYYADNTHNYAITFAGSDGYTEYFLDFVATTLPDDDPTKMLPTGEFAIKSDVTTGGAYAGGVEEGSMVGCFVAFPDWDIMAFRYGFMKSGTVTISANTPEEGESVVYTIEIEAYDDHHAPGYKISGTFEGAIAITDETAGSGTDAVAPAAAAANKFTHAYPAKARR